MATLPRIFGKTPGRLQRRGSVRENDEIKLGWRPRYPKTFAFPRKETVILFVPFLDSLR
jgi:hypothetical protein